MTDERLKQLSQLGGDIAELADEVQRLRKGTITSPTTPPASPLRVGNNVFIRTVTVYHVGHVEAVTAEEVILTSASWIGSSGRFYNALASGSLDEIEPFPHPVSVTRGTIVDVTDWVHPLPRSQK